MEKEKVHMNDILDGEIQRPVKVLIVGDAKYYADRTSKEQLSTHRDCEQCGVEFEKSYTYDKYCPSCKIQIDRDKYLKLPLVGWNGETPLAIWNDDTYFFSEDDIIQYCEDNKVSPASLSVVICEPTSFSPIDFDQWNDDTHDDWEPDQEMINMVNNLNNYLKNASTNTWIGTNKRVDLSDLKID